MIITTILSSVSTLALCSSVLIATHNVRQQVRLSRQSRAVDAFNRCLTAFDDLETERTSVEASTEPPAARQLRARRYYGRYWDLMVREFELARAGILPVELFERWFLVAQAELVGPEADATLAGVSARQAWSDIGRARVRFISDAFETLVERTIDELDQVTVLTTLRSAMQEVKGGGVFRALA